MCEKGTCTSSFGKAHDSWFKKLKSYRGFDDKKEKRRSRRKMERRIAGLH